MSARARAARRAEAERVVRSAALLADGEALSREARAALVDLLEHLAGPACEVVPTTVWDRTAKLAQCVWEPHRITAINDRPPNVGGGEPSQAAQRHS